MSRVVSSRSPKLPSPRFTPNFQTPLRECRFFRRLRQTDLAALAGVSQGTLSAIERGIQKPSEAVRKKISEALELPESSIFPGVEE